MTPIYVAQIVKKRNTHKDLFRKSEAKGQFGTARRRWNDELYDLYSSPNIVRVIKSRRMRWAGHVALMGDGGGVYRVLVWETQREETNGKT